MVDLIEAITKGIDLFSFFYSKYYGPVKYRPLTSMELAAVMDDCIANKPWEMKEFLLDLHVRHRIPKSLPREMSHDFAKLYDHMCALIVYHAVKEFQPENWQHRGSDFIPLGLAMLEGPMSYLEVNDMAMEVMALSTRPQEELKAFIKTPEGENLAVASWKLNVPLNDKMWKLTDLQVSFMIETSKLRKEYHTLSELQADMPMQIRETTPEEVELLAKCEKIRQGIRS